MSPSVRALRMVAAAALASACGGRLVGEAGVVVEGARSLEAAGSRDVAFAADAKAEKAAAASAAGLLKLWKARATAPP